MHTMQAMTGRFSKPSDVWSYGVVLWEIATRCAERPFTSMEKAEIALGFLQAGGRLTLPPTAPSAFVLLVQDCWQLDPKARPTFEQILLKGLSPSLESTGPTIPYSAKFGERFVASPVSPTSTASSSTASSGDHSSFLNVQVMLGSGEKRIKRYRITPTLTFADVVQTMAQDRAREYELQTEDGIALAGNVSQYFPGQTEVTVYLRKAEALA